MQSINTLKLSHLVINKYVKEGDICVDATMGRGRDTLFLSQIVSEKGKVFSFDIQKEAVLSTEKLLKENNINNVTLICDGHENMAKYIPDGISCFDFNLGYLPGGDRSIQTKFETTKKAIETAMAKLKVGGIISICIYYGKDSGFDEKNSIIPFLKEIDSENFTVIMGDFINRPNNPPIYAVIIKEK
ncbi:MAG: class I SAM-dependent methyltransferase [Clostridia bacterium]|nr:class I SAM-dependent methyltransferase [Clostridia bacterium]